MKPYVEMTEDVLEIAEHISKTWYPHPDHDEKRFLYHPLSSTVLAVAVAWPEAGDFKVYLDSVPGFSHPGEVIEVIKHGEKQPEHIARAIFHWLDGLTYDKY